MSVAFACVTFFFTYTLTPMLMLMSIFCCVVGRLMNLVIISCCQILNGKDLECLRRF